MIIMIAMAILGGFVGHKFNREIRVYSTSIIGAGLLVIGANSFLGGLSFVSFEIDNNESLKETTPIYAAYLVGFILVSVSGIYVQLKYTDKEE